MFQYRSLSKIISFLILVQASCEMKRKGSCWYNPKEDFQEMRVCYKDGTDRSQPIGLDVQLTDDPESFSKTIHALAETLQKSPIQGFKLHLRIKVHPDHTSPIKDEENRIASAISEITPTVRDQTLQTLGVLLAPLRDDITELTKDVSTYMKLLSTIVGGVIVKVSTLVNKISAMLDVVQ